MSVDAAAAVERNRPVIDQIRQIVSNPPRPSATPTAPPAPSEAKPQR